MKKFLVGLLLFLQATHAFAVVGKICGPFCDSLTSQAQCDGIKGCLWNRVSEKCVSTLFGSCADFPDKDACDKMERYGLGCIWDEEDSSCQNYWQSCKEFNSASSCNKANCFWSTTDNNCYSLLWRARVPYFCSDFSAPNVCKEKGCLWDKESNTCNTSMQFCSAFKNEDICFSAKCAWDKKNKCLDANNSIFTCSYFTEEDICQTVGCKWTGKSCSSTSPMTCSGYESKKTCSENNCYWNGTKCVREVCGNISEENDCSQAGCVWENKTTTCHNKIFSVCSSFKSKTSCKNSIGCSYTGSTCVNSWISSCNDFSEEQCNKNGCAWDALQDMCLSQNNLSCGSYSTHDSCTMSGCLWSQDSNQCISYYAQCNSFSFEKCPSDFCRKRNLKCETANCNLTLNKDDCSSQKNCKWVRLGFTGYCSNK